MYPQRYPQHSARSKPVATVRVFTAVLLALLVSTATAQTVVDGDTIKLDGTTSGQRQPSKNLLLLPKQQGPGIGHSEVSLQLITVGGGHHLSLPAGLMITRT